MNPKHDRIKSKRNTNKLSKSTTDLKAQYEKMRSEALDKESARLRVEREQQAQMAKFKTEEDKLETILHSLNSKTTMLKKINTQKVQDLTRRHEDEMEAIKYEYEQKVREAAPE